jgi:hypothetical protein
MLCAVFFIIFAKASVYLLTSPLCLFICLWLYSPLLDLGRFFSFLIYTHSVGLFGRGISPSQCRYLTQENTNRINTHRHPCLEWDSNPRSQWLRGRRYFSCFRPRGHCDQISVTLVLQFHFHRQLFIQIRGELNFARRQIPVNSCAIDSGFCERVTSVELELCRVSDMSRAYRLQAEGVSVLLQERVQFKNYQVLFLASEDSSYLRPRGHCDRHPYASLTLTHSWSWALLEKLPIVQLLENFPAFYGTRRFFTAFT